MGQICLTAGTVALQAANEYVLDLSAGGHWFGHGFAHEQPLPLERGSIVNEHFAVNNIQSPIWLCSAGFALLLETDEELSVRINDGGDGCLRLRPTTDCSLHIFQGADLPTARAAMLQHLGARRASPPAAMLGDSIFCTWTQYPRCIDQQRIIAMAEAIREQGYPCSTITIDDRWERCFGELAFGDDFPDPKAMVDRLHELGFRVLLWVTPFVNQEAQTFGALSASGALVQHRDGSGAATMRWWGGCAGLVDLTHPAGRSWYAERLTVLRDEIGIDGFKIDGGDAKYQPAAAIAAFHEPLGASGYVDRLLELFTEIAPQICESRTAWLSQQRQILWRLGGKDSHWGRDNGLKALVNLSLHLALCGYDLLIPDMVPGRVQTMNSDDPLPSDELMLRWCEVSACMPMLQLSYFPWNYAPATARAVAAYAQLHKALEPYLVACLQGDQPLLSPAWYQHPDQEALYGIDDQFYLGPDLLVCPVLDPGIEQRTIVLPDSGWQDAWTGTAMAAGEQLVAAPCPGMPIYVRSSNTELAAALAVSLAAIERGTVASGICTASYQAGLNRDLSVTG